MHQFMTKWTQTQTDELATTPCSGTLTAHDLAFAASQQLYGIGGWATGISCWSASTHSPMNIQDICSDRATLSRLHFLLIESFCVLVPRRSQSSICGNVPWLPIQSPTTSSNIGDVNDGLHVIGLRGQNLAWSTRPDIRSVRGHNNGTQNVVCVGQNRKQPMQWTGF